MQKNDLLKFENSIVRILETTEDKVLVIDCIKITVPKRERNFKFGIIKRGL